MGEVKVFAQSLGTFRMLVYLVVLALTLTACGGTPPTANQQPNPPTNVTVTPGPGYVTVEWTHDGQNVTAFDVYRDAVSATSLAAMAIAKVGETDANARTFRDTDVEPESSYTYSVVARGPQGASQPTVQTGGPVSSEPLFEIVAGTYNIAVFDTPRTAFLSLYSFEGAPVETAAGTITGPTGWNDGEAYAYNTAPELIERGWGRLHTGIVAVSGSYQADITVAGDTHTATATLDTSQLLPAPQNVRVTSASTNEVTASWDTVAGARSYQAFIREDPNVLESRTLATVFVATPSATLSGLELPAGEYRLEVNAFPVDFTTNQRPERPEHFNISYNRSAPFTVE